MAAGRLEGKLAIVTGAAQGIGRTYALALAAAGAKVCVTDLSPPEDTAAAIARAGGVASAVKGDVSDRDSLQSMVSHVQERFGRLDILVNNAGLFGALKMKSFSEIAIEEWDRVMAVNVRGVWQAIAVGGPAQKASGG